MKTKIQPPYRITPFWSDKTVCDFNKPAEWAVVAPDGTVVTHPELSFLGELIEKAGAVEFTLDLATGYEHCGVLGCTGKDLVHDGLFIGLYGGGVAKIREYNIDTAWVAQALSVPRCEGVVFRDLARYLIWESAADMEGDYTFARRHWRKVYATVRNAVKLTSKVLI